MVVVAGVTLIEEDPKTDPTPLSMLKDVGLPPERVQESVVDWPLVMVEDADVNVLIMGAWTATGVTVIVTCFVADPPLLVAVIV